MLHFIKLREVVNRQLTAKRSTQLVVLRTRNLLGCFYIVMMRVDVWLWAALSSCASVSRVLHLMLM